MALDQHEVYKDRKLVFAGSYFECFKFIMDHQPQSVYWAEKYGGWSIKPLPKSTEIEDEAYMGTLVSPRNKKVCTTIEDVSDLASMY